MAKPPELFGPWLRRKLSELGWSQDRAAREFDLTGSTVRNWVRPADSTAPRYDPSYRQLLKVITALGELPPEIDRAVRSPRLVRTEGPHEPKVAPEPAVVPKTRRRHVGR